DQVVDLDEVDLTECGRPGAGRLPLPAELVPHVVPTFGADDVLLEAECVALLDLVPGGVGVRLAELADPREGNRSGLGAVGHDTEAGHAAFGCRRRRGRRPPHR